MTLLRHSFSNYKYTFSFNVNVFTGFCLFNNVAVAAAYARHVYRHQGIQKVAILDFDVHHGNGTEALVRNLEPSMVTNTFPTLFGDVTMDSPSYKPWYVQKLKQNENVVN